MKLRNQSCQLILGHYKRCLLGCKMRYFGILIPKLGNLIRYLGTKIPNAWCKNAIA